MSRAWTCALAVAVMALARAAAARTLVVSVPASTPPADTVWMSGDAPALGAWSGRGLPLRPDGRRRWTLVLPAGLPGTVEYKITRGSWATVEKDSGGGEIPNRRLEARGTDPERISVGAWRDQVEHATPRAHTLTGDVRVHPAFPSRHVAPRTVRVWLPPGYAADSTRRYPVLYFHDGNNVFDAATSFLGVEWGVDEAATRLIGTGRLAPLIVVGADNTAARIAEYTPMADARLGGGRANDYEAFLVEELKPFIDGAYRTLTDRAHTGTVGSSLGGIVALDLALTHPDVFGLVGCVSPAAGWGGRAMVARLAATPARPLKLWMDTGTDEGDDPADQVADARALRDAAATTTLTPGGPAFHYEEVPGARHNERAWAARVDRILEFLIGAP